MKERQASKKILLLMLCILVWGCNSAEDDGLRSLNDDPIEAESAQQWSIPDDIERFLGFTSPVETEEYAEDIEENSLR